MRFLELTLPTPAENLACDEALLDWAEAEGGEVLRCWEPPPPVVGRAGEASGYFVVVGCGNSVAREVRQSDCERLRVGIFRRCSGGGAVVQGPGCLNYSLVLQISRQPELAGIPETNRYVMARQQEVAGAAGVEPVAVRGHTDLVLGERKFSGNAQRRKRRALLFHGTFLCAFDLARLEEFLRPPSREPDYRQGRSHLDFVTNLSLPPERLRAAFRQVWAAHEPLAEWPRAGVAALTAGKYSRAEWNFKLP